MTDLTDLVLTIVRPLVTQPDLVKLDVEESADFYEYNLSVAPEDIGRIIGKQGRVAKAIRTIVYGVRTEGTKKIRLNILDGKQPKIKTVPFKELSFFILQTEEKFTAIGDNKRKRGGKKDDRMARNFSNYPYLVYYF